MSRTGFLARFFGSAADDAADKGIEFLANAFPATATKAQIAQFEATLASERNKLTEARQVFNKEKGEADAAEKAQNTRIQAAKTLRDQRDAATDDAKKAAFDAAFQKQMGEVKKHQPNVEREKAEAATAERILANRTLVYEKALKNVTEAKARLNQGNLERQAANLELQLAQDELESARAVAGLGNQTSTVDIVGSAFDKQTANAKAQAETLRQEAALLNAGAASAASEDPLIAAAMAQASGTPASKSADDELDALLGK